ncbi:MAG: replication factor C small subunit [Candidatus Thorarchaeota archaeon]
MIDLETPWVEKYRPKTFDDIVSQNIAVNNLREFTKSGDMPHLIFAGPAGTGKTSTALIVAREMTTKDRYHRNVLELNASDTVRMDYVRNVIKDFVSQKMIIDDASLKFIILDEADNIPGQVQQALRRIIELSSNNVKFILLCNYINRIIDPIVSRCAVFRFVSLSEKKIIERLKYIVKQENIKISQDKRDLLYKTLFFISGGDLRKAINTLQMSVALKLTDDLDLDEILRISGFLDEETLEKLASKIIERDMANVREIVDGIINFDSRNLIKQIIEILPQLKINPKNLSSVISHIGTVDYRLSQSADENIQLTSLIAEIIKNVNI